MQTLDLTCASYCTEKTEKVKRNQRAREYSENIKAKKAHLFKENMLMIASVICINVSMFFVFIDAFL